MPEATPESSSPEESGPGEPTTGEAPPPKKRRGLTRRLYDWVLHWADTPYGTPALFLISFAESSFFPIPPDPLLLALAVGNRARALFYGFMCTAGSVLGGLFGYWIGMRFMDSFGQWIIDTYHLQEQFEKLGTQFQEYGALTTLTAALTPIPYKVITIAAGAFEVSLVAFIGGSVVGRGLRFMGEGAMIHFFGERIKAFVDRYFEWLSILFVVLLIGGFALIKVLGSK